MKSLQKRNIAVVLPPSINISATGGGAEAVGVWMADALQEQHQVSLITVDPHLDKAGIDSYFGTSLGKQVRIRCLPLPRWLQLLHRGAVLRQHLLMRHLKSLHAEYDLIIGTLNEIDLGHKCIQYVHFPSLAEDTAAEKLLDLPRSFLYKHTIRKGYKAMGAYLSGFCEKSMKENITITNSEWTSSILRSAYGPEINPRVIHPPVRESFSITPWNERSDGFLCVGRISPEKGIHSLIAILEEVRTRGVPVTFRLVGPPGPDTAYVQKTRKMIRERSWITWEGALQHKDFLEMLSSCKFGIHGMQHEHFGIVVAEMIKAGSIVFAPVEGGSAAIVANEERLTYKNHAEAVGKICSLLREPQAQLQLRDSLSNHANRFSIRQFSSEVRDVVDGYFCHASRNSA